MVDNVSKGKRSEIMSKIRSTRTKPELILKSLLDGRVFKYQPNGIPGKPDFGNKSRKVAVFIDGCFWHGCPKHCRLPTSNKEYWLPKIEKNKRRDKKHARELKKEGWVVIRVWEHEVNHDINSAIKKIQSVL